MRTHSEVEKFVEFKYAELECLESNCQKNLLYKKCSLLEDVLKSRGKLLEKTCIMLQKCYLQLRGYSFATDTLTQDYYSLVKHLQGKRNVSWDSPVVSGLSSTSVSSTDVDIKPIKRRRMDQSKPKVKGCAEEIMVKVYKTPDAIKKNKEVYYRGLTATRLNGPSEKNF